MKNKFFFTCLYLIGSFNSSLLAQAPANDDCANAIGLNVSSGMLCQTSTNGTTTGATTSTTIGQPDCSGGAIDDDVWYKFVATGDQHIVTVNGGSPMYYPRFEAYNGTCGNLSSLGVCVTAAGTTAEGLLTGLTIGTTYYVRVYSSSTNGGYKGPFSICITSFTNDECTGAVSLTPGSSCSVTYGSTRFATASTTIGQALCSSHSGWSDDDVWYKFTTPSTPASSYTVSINGSTFPSGTALVSPQMTIYSGSCGSLSPISTACTNPVSGACVYTQSSNLSGLSPNTTYYIRVYSWVTASSYKGQFTICVTSGTAATPQLAVNPTSLNFGSICVGDSSTQSFTITGAQLNSGNINVGPLTGFEFSTNNSSFSSTLSITSCGGALSQIVYVKFKPTAGQTYNGSIPVSGGGATAVSVSIIAAGSAGVPASLPDAVSSQDTLCAGNSATLSIQSGNLNSASSWQWYTGSCEGTVAGSGAFISVSPANSTTYYVRGVGNCVASGACDSVRVIVTNGASPAVLISANPSGPACVGSPITFTATPSNGGNFPAYQWRINGVSQGTGTATFTSSALNNGDIITCQLTSSALCAVPLTAVSNSISVSLIPSVQPTINISSSQPGTVCAGTNITFTALSTNEGSNPVYQWQVNGISTGNNSNIFSIASLVNGDVVQCTLTSSATCAIPSQLVSNSFTASVSQPATPSVILTSSAMGSVCPGTVITITATPFQGGSAPVYQWSVNGTPTGSNSASFSSNQLANGDVISCQMTSSASCITSNTATSNAINVAISDVVIPQISISAVSSAVICRGSLASFIALPNGGGNNPLFDWMVNGISTGVQSATFSSANLNQNDQISCRLVSSETCANPQSTISNTITVTVNEVNTTIGLTNGGNSLTASQTSAQYQWINCPDFSWIPGENNITFSPSTPGSYACIITQNNCSDTSDCLSVFPTTITPIALSPTILVHPSPTQDNVFILTNTSEPIELMVTDVTGREVIHKILTQRKTLLSLRRLLGEEGLYLFTFRTANNLETRKVLFTR